jgi:hypothetical protein
MADPPWYECLYVFPTEILTIMIDFLLKGRLIPIYYTTDLPAGRRKLRSTRFHGRAITKAITAPPAPTESSMSTAIRNYSLINTTIHDTVSKYYTRSFSDNAQNPPRGVNGGLPNSGLYFCEKYDTLFFQTPLAVIAFCGGPIREQRNFAKSSIITFNRGVRSLAIRQDNRTRPAFDVEVTLLLTYFPDLEFLYIEDYMNPIFEADDRAAAGLSRDWRKFYLKHFNDLWTETTKDPSIAMYYPPRGKAPRLIFMTRRQMDLATSLGRLVFSEAELEATRKEGGIEQWIGIDEEKQENENDYKQGGPEEDESHRLLLKLDKVRQVDLKQDNLYWYDAAKDYKSGLETLKWEKLEMERQEQIEPEQKTGEAIFMDHPSTCASAYPSDQEDLEAEGDPISDICYGDDWEKGFEIPTGPNNSSSSRSMKENYHFPTKTETWKGLPLDARPRHNNWIPDWQCRDCHGAKRRRDENDHSDNEVLSRLH